MKKWSVAKLNKESATKIAEEHGIPFFLAMMLDIRGIVRPEVLTDYLSTQIVLSDPFKMKDMDRAVKRIRQAVDRFEKICVYGDYDADGVTATALLYSYLDSCVGNVMYYIPEREGEGYGLNTDAVNHLHAMGVQLIITVDNGIASFKEVAYATSLGIDVVVTDHHQLQGELPAAVAVVDPHRPDCPSTFKDFSGVGVAFKLVSALEGEEGDFQGLLENYSDLVALGTVGDIVPLLQENRVLVQAGLRYMQHTDRAGLRAMIAEAGLEGKPLTAGNLAFSLVPRINALGRLAASEDAVRLLLTEYKEEAESFALTLGEKNRTRQKIEGEIFDAAIAFLRDDPQRLYDRVLVIDGEGWHPGVIGIVASRITERFGKPCVMISKDGTEARGSGRSISGFSLYEAVYSCRHLLTRFGGHPMAAGMSLPAQSIGEFRNCINRYAADLEGGMPAPQLRIDCKLKPSALSVDLIRQLSALEPYGAGNPAPLFGLYGMKLEEIAEVGGGKHLRLIFSRENIRLTIMRFSMNLQECPYLIGDMLDLAVSLSVTEFRGEESLSIVIRDWKLSQTKEDDYINEKSLYETIKRKEPLKAETVSTLIPSREDFALVYRYLRGTKAWDYPLDVLCWRLPSHKISYCKVMLILDMMQELNLITYWTDGDIYHISLLEVEGKVDIFSSGLMQTLRDMKE
jgi:single-stranded-DNA-specific exonuclease